MIDKKTVQHVALLSRLRLDDKELARYSAQLATILAYIDTLNTLDTLKAQPTSHASHALENVDRPDTLKTSLEPGDVLSNAPETQGDFFKIPKVIEGK